MARMFLPPGFRFHPTDVELVKYYLKRKVMGKKFPIEAISELNIYKFSPWDLRDKSFLQGRGNKTKDREWYFFCPRERKYASGIRTSRTTENGYWKITCKDKRVLHNEKTVGIMKTLVFHQGHAPQVERTDWFMHEYRIEDKDLTDAGVIQDAYVLCRIFKKSGPGPKNGVQYGDRFSEEDWYDEVEDAPSPAAFVLPNNQNISSVTSMLIPEITSSVSMSEAGPSNAVPFAEEVPQPPADDDDFVSQLAMFTEDNTLLSDEHNNNVDWYDEVEDAPSPAAFVLPNNQNISSVTSMLIPEITSSVSMSEAGPSNAVPFAEEVPQPPADDDDFVSQLAMFTEDDTLLSDEHNNNVMPDDFNHDRNIGDVSWLDGNCINNSLADLSDLPELNEGGFNFSSNQKAGSALNSLLSPGTFLELNDLKYPLVCPAEASGSESFLTGSLYTSSNHCNNEEQNCCPVNSFDSVQHVSSVNESPVPPEGFNKQGNYFDVLQKENDIRESANQGCNATLYNEDFIPCRQPEEGVKHAMQDRKRGRFRYFQ
ncbi:NAC domain-containing protein 17-like isoform X1 [Cornus florida]|uniref:NAC domain-containing protein 17-like isoform X1 n=1 Tax=Cornus florida TaxID=4283 RepID=UPI00289B70E6|nr:NAC domain-containing protein 17-like isoform X1 [Cornus florida]